jgi:hypothetical protein
MEMHYHDPEPFRYSLNSFIRAAKEVPGILQADLQNHAQVRVQVATGFETLNQNPLFVALKKRRDFLVHRGMLEPQSNGSVGTTEGHQIKIAIPFPVFPHERSDEAYERYIASCRTNKILRQLSGPDSGSGPAIWRTWLIPQFPGRDLLEVVFEAWLLTGKLLSAAVVALGEPPLDLELLCRHSVHDIQIKRFNRRDFFLRVDGIDIEEEARRYREFFDKHRKPSDS